MNNQIRVWNNKADEIGMFSSRIAYIIVSEDFINEKEYKLRNHNNNDNGKLININNRINNEDIKKTGNKRIIKLQEKYGNNEERNDSKNINDGNNKAFEENNFKK